MRMPLGHRLRKSPAPLLITGHTGFNGTWMTFLLEFLNVSTVGYSLSPEKGSLFERASRAGAIPEKFADIRDYETLENFIDKYRPSTIIHMAAQPLVLKSYERPRETFEVNVMGTVNLLDIATRKDFVQAIIVVTTDKVYRNDNSGTAFKETDPLEGKDPYSASKVGTESVVTAWQQMVRVSGGPKIVSVRAGNIIGGGDFAKDRLIPDFIRGLISKNVIKIRNPESVRPWQYVLDASAGYLMALEYVLENNHDTSFNFGSINKNLTVKEITEIARSIFPNLKFEFDTPYPFNQIESKTLNLDSEKSQTQLSWNPVYSQIDTVVRTFEWWNTYFSQPSSILNLCQHEVSDFIKIFNQKIKK